MENELRIAAGEAEKCQGVGEVGVEEVEEAEEVQTEVTPEQWEDRWEEEPIIRRKLRKLVPKVRKPVIVKEWFGIGSSSDDSEPESEQWSDVDRKKRNHEKKMKAAQKKQTLKQECATRAMNMFSIGPISVETVEYFRKRGLNFEEAKISALKEFLQYNLNYGTEELDSLTIAETRLSTKGDEIFNVALVDKDDVKEVFVRRAEWQ